MNTQAEHWAKVAASLTEEERDWLMSTRRRRLAGGRKLTNAEIGAKIGKPHQWVSAVCLALGSKPRRKRRRNSNLTDQDNALFARMWADGVITADIGKHWGFSPDWASVHAHRLGLPSRRNVITGKQVAEMKRRLSQGQRRDEIAAAMGVGKTAVRRYTLGLRSSAPKRTRIPKKVDGGLADRMARTGMLHREIAVHFGVQRSAVGRAINRYRKRIEALSAKKPAFLIPPVKPDTSIRQQMKEAA